jgi:hypothetical protein
MKIVGTILLLIMFFLLPRITYSQKWIKLPNSDIKFSNFQADSSIRWQDFDYEYFLKGDRMLSVSKGISDEFKALLTEAPKIFEDLYKCAYNVSKKEELGWTKESFGGQLLDTLVMNVPFKSTVVISSRTYYQGVNESIWILSNPPAMNELGGWYLKMVFRIKGKKLKYLMSDKDHIVI